MNLKPIRRAIDYSLNDEIIDKDEFINNLFSFLSSHKLLFSKQLVIGVSGGPDSMLLSYFLKNFGIKYSYKIHAVIVDHQFRKSSFEEAKITLNRLKMTNIDAEIIKLNKKCRNSGLQEWAHFKRLEILSSIAKSKNALLFLGHHLNDQVETVFMRMSKNTGFWGASGIKFLNYWFNTPVIRPLHQFTKNSIIKTCRKYSIQFEVDASNFDTKYDRVKIRQTLGQINNRKRLFKNIYLSSFFIGNIANIIDEKIYQICSSSFPIHDLGFSVVDVPSLSNLNKSIALRVLMLIIKTVGGNKYFVKNKNANSLLKHLIKHKNILSKMPGRTLGGCKIIYRYQRVFILRWSQHNAKKKVMSNLGNMIFDNRWQIFSKPEIEFECLQQKHPIILQDLFSKTFKIPIEALAYIPVSLKIFNFKKIKFYLDDMNCDNHISICEHLLIFISKEYNINIKFIKPITPKAIF